MTPRRPSSFMAARSPYAEVLCPVCGDGLPRGAPRCRICETPHHDECWEYNGGCATYGCASTARRGRRILRGPVVVSVPLELPRLGVSGILLGVGLILALGGAAAAVLAAVGVPALVGLFPTPLGEFYTWLVLGTPLGLGLASTMRRFLVASRRTGSSREVTLLTPFEGAVLPGPCLPEDTSAVLLRWKGREATGIDLEDSKGTRWPLPLHEDLGSREVCRAARELAHVLDRPLIERVE